MSKILVTGCSFGDTNLPDYSNDAIHNKLHKLAIYLVSISGQHWANLTDLTIPEITVDLSDDNTHPGIKTGAAIREIIEQAAHRLNYNYF